MKRIFQVCDVKRIPTRYSNCVSYVMCVCYTPVTGLLVWHISSKIYVAHCTWIWDSAFPYRVRQCILCMRTTYVEFLCRHKNYYSWHKVPTPATLQFSAKRMYVSIWVLGSVTKFVTYLSTISYLCHSKRYQNGTVRHEKSTRCETIAWRVIRNTNIIHFSFPARLSITSE